MFNFRLQREREWEREGVDICMYICTWISVFTSVSLYLSDLYLYLYNIYMYLCIYICICTPVFVSLYLHLYLYLCIYICILVSICMYVCYCLLSVIHTTQFPCTHFLSSFSPPTEHLVPSWKKSPRGTTQLMLFKHLKAHNSCSIKVTTRYGKITQLKEWWNWGLFGEQMIDYLKITHFIQFLWRGNELGRLVSDGS